MTTLLARTGSAEWSRLWTVRSTWWFFAAMAVLVIGAGGLVGLDVAGDPAPPPPDVTAWDAGRFTGMFVLFGLLAVSVVSAAADHATGNIVPTLQWTPRRGVLLTARVGVIVGTATLLGVLLVTGASLAVWAFVPDVGLPVGDGARTLGELGIVFAAGSALAVGLSLATRSTAAALVCVVALVLVLPVVLAQLPYDWAVDIAGHLPGSGALFLIFGEGPPGVTTASSARLTMASWALAALAAGGLRLVRADADH